MADARQMVDDFLIMPVHPVHNTLLVRKSTMTRAEYERLDDAEVQAPAGTNNTAKEG
jgi:hypothetical protein